MPKKTQRFFVGMPRKISQGNSKRFCRIIFQENFASIFFGNVKIFFSGGNSTIFFRIKKNFQRKPKPFFKNFSKFASNKRVAKDIDPTRVKRIELTNKDKIRNMLETQAYFPQESHSGFFRILRKTILDYFLPFPPSPPWDDKRNSLPDHREK